MRSAETGSVYKRPYNTLRIDESLCKT